MPNMLTERPYAESLPPTSNAATIINGHYAPPPQDGHGKIWVRTSTLIQSSPEKLYQLWHDLENIPAWQEEIQSVTITGEKRSHWIMKSGSQTVEWDSEILNDEPGKRITWHSVGGDSQNAGEVIFEPAPSNRGTVVTVLQEFGMGRLTAIWETLTGRNPKQSVIENLRHFKALAEAGEISRTDPQPHGDRGFIGNRKRSMYGETIPTPSGTRNK